MRVESVGDRIRRLRKSLGLTQVKLAQMLGIKAPSVVQWESDKTNLSGENLLNAAKLFGVTPDYILYGGEIEQSAAPNMEMAQPDIHRIPVISYVQAGVWTAPNEIRECDGNMAYITTDLELGDRAFAIVIRGNSMEPEFTEGDLVLIDPDEPLHPGDFVVAKNGEEEATFKKYRPRGYSEDGKEIFELAPLNDDYATMRSDRQPIQIIGTMVEHRRRRRRR
ncbi:LexA family protein [Aeromonas veronii]|uniref:DNA-binding protein n=2 Tax=Aeromonas TaxID=642 RepID=A0A653KXU7_AERVE|nr:MULTISPECIES: S24 family peptidase [Aeromonas]MDH0475551.1 helix-turn-helix domain-containing protein [Aeromonas caviae]MDX7718932.1 S24 family peptidase [Aeromonas caviae]VXA84040.1 DNA-binding protein [Aeromonas veronii]